MRLFIFACMYGYKHVCMYVCFYTDSRNLSNPCIHYFIHREPLIFALYSTLFSSYSRVLSLCLSLCLSLSLSLSLILSLSLPPPTSISTSLSVCLSLSLSHSLDLSASPYFYLYISLSLCFLLSSSFISSSHWKTLSSPLLFFLLSLSDVSI